MSTAKTIVDDALRLCNENSSVLTVEPEMQQQGFARLVDWLNLQRGDGLYLTPQIPATINSELREMSWAKQGIIFDLAFNLAPFIQTKEFSQMFFTVRENSLTTLYINAKQPTDQQYPETLPIGGGNEWYNSWSFRFYGENDLAEYQVYETQNKGESALYVADFDADAVKRNTTVSSIVWESLENFSVDITNEALVNNIAQAQLTFNGAGTATFRARATYANTEIQDFLFQVLVVDV